MTYDISVKCVFTQLKRWEHVGKYALGTECPRIFCEGIGSLQHGVVLVFIIFKMLNIFVSDCLLLIMIMAFQCGFSQNETAVAKENPLWHFEERTLAS